MLQQLQFALDDMGRRLGLPGLPLSAEGTARLKLDDVEIEIGYLASADAAQFYAILGAMPEDASVPYVQILLAANHLQQMTDGGAIAYDKEDEVVTLNKR